MKVKRLLGAVSLAALMGSVNAPPASAQVPEDIYQGLLKIGQIVDPACTAKLYRPLMPTADYNTYWAPGAAAPDPSKAKLYPGVTITRDQKFGPHDKDLIDIFVGDTGGGNRPVIMWVPGGGGNKIEQQVREANAFYDNIGRWGTKNGYVVVTVQRHQGQNWDDGGRDIAAAVDWVKANIGRYQGNGNNIYMAAHSAGTGPTGVYVGHPERWPNGVQIKAIVYMSGGPIPGILPAAPGAGRGGPGAGPNANGPGSSCGTTAAQNGTEGAISGPSGATPAAPRAGGPGGAPGAPGGGRGGPQLTPEQVAERDNLPGFKKTNVKVMIVRAELDPGVTGDMTAADKAIRDTLCAVDGPNAKEGQGHCPTLLYAKRQSHMGEVFAFDTPDTSVSKPILDFFKSVK
jgi:pimeloyl-ACP methyl ester carboxylesterase